MAEILIKAKDTTHPDPEKDRRGCYKRGMPVAIMPDGHEWGKEERPPKFVVLKLPGVPVEKVRHYIEPETTPVPDPSGNFPVYRRRLWQISWADLPKGAKDKLAAGTLTIQAGTYDGPYDYTWAQVKAYFRKVSTGEAETAEL